MTKGCIIVSWSSKECLTIERKVCMLAVLKSVLDRTNAENLGFGWQKESLYNSCGFKDFTSFSLECFDGGWEKKKDLVQNPIF